MTQLRNPFKEQQTGRRVQRVRESSGSRAHDVQNLYVSLKQWRILHAVIDCGGFAGAAEHLHLSQSAISYTISKLQEQLGVQLLKIEGRKAHLTPAGRTLLDRSRHVLKKAVELEMLAKHLGKGWGSEIRLAVDPNFPAPLLMCALRKFNQSSGSSYVRLNELCMARTEEALRDRSVDLAISPRVPMGYLGEPLFEVEYVAVAHADHPLLDLGRDVTVDDLERQIQIGIEQSNELENGAGNTRQLCRWSLSSFDAVVNAVCECLGYAWLPRHRVQTWLDQGALKLLPMGEKGSYRTMLYLIHGQASSENFFVSRLAEIMHSLAVKDSLTLQPHERLLQTH